ncbi:helix-turn-helix domain-containing protein [Rhodopseudomonas sp. RCAM05734]|uniref:helix-turn-helix domain-containing protein n=1 Tax=Rhodopseudomonas sp. RCAM05734 TaxID=3457549 RepID=UPI0040441DD6
MTSKDIAAIQQWSTRLVEPARRLDYWIGAVCASFLEMEIKCSAPSDFHCALERGQLETIGINHVQGHGQHVYRTRPAIVRSVSNYYYLLCKVDFEWAAVQNDNSVCLRPNDLLLIDSRCPYEFHFEGTSNTLSLELPIAWVESWISQPQKCIGRRIDGNVGWGLALSAFARQLSPALALHRPLPAQILTDQLGALLALAFGAEVPVSGSDRRGAEKLLAKIQTVVRMRYAEPGLTAAAVAADLHVSERTLHRCLNGAALTFGGLLSECRMSAARRMLSEARFDHVSVGGIGLKVGLSDPSHFIRQCRRYLGTTPGEFRRSR